MRVHARSAGYGNTEEEGEVDEMTGEIRRVYGKRKEEDVDVRVRGEKLRVHVCELIARRRDVPVRRIADETRQQPSCSATDAFHHKNVLELAG